MVKPPGVAMLTFPVGWQYPKVDGCCYRHLASCQGKFQALLGSGKWGVNWKTCSHGPQSNCGAGGHTYYERKEAKNIIRTATILKHLVGTRHCADEVICMSLSVPHNHYEVTLLLSPFSRGRNRFFTCLLEFRHTTHKRQSWD